jgi:hypothetical protein
VIADVRSVDGVADEAEGEQDQRPPGQQRAVDVDLASML